MVRFSTINRLTDLNFRGEIDKYCHDAIVDSWKRHYGLPWVIVKTGYFLVKTTKNHGNIYNSKNHYDI